MTQNQTNSFVSSKFGRVFLMIVTMLLVFAGPTYFVYLLAEVLGIGLAVSLISGLVLLVVGLVMLRFLVKQKIIT